MLDRRNYHLFTPLLYQVASALLDPGEIARPIRELIRPLDNVEFRQAEVTGADLDRHLVLTDHGPVPYDYLVLATGSQSDYFGNQSLALHAFGLKELGDVLTLRNRGSISDETYRTIEHDLDLEELRFSEGAIAEH